MEERRSWNFQDAEGNIRPNWTVYGTFALGQKYDYDPDTKSFVFYANGRTFRYDPVERHWIDLAPSPTPRRNWAGFCCGVPMCYDRHNKQFVLFGGGNVQTERGDPGTWTYTPATNTWTRLKLDSQPPQRANSRLCLRSGQQEGRPFRRRPARPVAGRHLDLRCRYPEMGAEEAGPLAFAACRACPALAAQGEEGPARWAATATPRRSDYVEGLLSPLAAGSLDLRCGRRRWELIKRFEGKQVPEGAGELLLSAAVDDEDNVLVVGTNGTWLCRLDASKPDARARSSMAFRPGGRRAAAPGPTIRPGTRKACLPPIPAKVMAELKDLPANQWVQRPTPKLPRPNMDWGSAVFAPNWT